MMLLWLVLGALVGALQARWLWRSAHRPAGFGVFGRLALVVAVLVPAARSGQLLWCAIGWGTSYLTQCLWLLRRRTQ